MNLLVSFLILKILFKLSLSLRCLYNERLHFKINQTTMGVFFGQLHSTDPLVNQPGRPDPNIQLLIFMDWSLGGLQFILAELAKRSSAHSTPIHLQVMYQALEGRNYLQSSTGQNPQTIGYEPRAPVLAAPSLRTRELTRACWRMRWTIHPSTDLPVQRPISQKSYS